MYVLGFGVSKFPKVPPVTVLSMHFLFINFFECMSESFQCLFLSPVKAIEYFSKPRRENEPKKGRWAGQLMRICCLCFVCVCVCVQFFENCMYRKDNALRWTECEIVGHRLVEDWWGGDGEGRGEIERESE